MIARILKQSSFAFLIGLFPILYTYAHNIYYVPTREIVAPIVLVLACTLLLLPLFRFVYRNTVKGALLLSLFWLLFFSYGAIHAILLDEFGYVFFTKHTFIIFFLALLFILAGVFLAKSNTSHNTIKITYAFVIALLLIPLLTISSYLYKETTLPYDPRTEFAEEINSSLSKDDFPDIVYIILDGYGREDILKKNYDLDNSAFINNLKKEGFFVASNSNSNYCRTAVTTASVFNLNYIHELENYDEDQSYNTLEKLIEGSFLVRFLSLYEYNIFSFASGFGITELTANATFLTPNPSALKDFHYMILNSSPFMIVLDNGFLFDKYCKLLEVISPNSNPALHNKDHHRDRILFALDSIPAYIGKAKPSFVFADIFVGHPPFIFDANGQYKDLKSYFHADGNEYMENNKGGIEEYILGCRDQTTYINKKLIGMIENLKQNITRPTVIILQGDHGPGAFYHQQDVSKTNLEDRFSILNAIYLSESKYYFPQDLTPVNTFRAILNSYFDANFSMLPNRQFYSGSQSICKFIEVTDSLKLKSDSLRQKHIFTSYSE